MPQPIMTKYKQGDLGKPYPKVKDKKNVNFFLLSQYFGNL